jgi:hypothetical protein
MIPRLHPKQEHDAIGVTFTSASPVVEMVLESGLTVLYWALAAETARRTNARRVRMKGLQARVISVLVAADSRDGEGISAVTDTASACRRFLAL